MQTYRIVEAFDVAEAGDLCFSLGQELSAREELALERREETFAHGIVVGVTDRSHGGPNADLTAATAKRERRVLGGFKWSSQQPSKGSCDGQPKAAFGSIWAGAIVVTWSTTGGRGRLPVGRAGQNPSRRANSPDTCGPPKCESQTLDH